MLRHDSSRKKKLAAGRKLMPSRDWLGVSNVNISTKPRLRRAGRSGSPALRFSPFKQV
jgi:hypothetical protein